MLLPRLRQLAAAVSALNQNQDLNIILTDIYCLFNQAGELGLGM